MTGPTKWLFGSMVAAVFFIAMPLTFFPAPATADKPVMALSTVLVQAGSGHGSAVHIGNGYYLSAGHVAKIGGKFTITNSMGQSAPATVLWFNPPGDGTSADGYDIALFRVDDDQFNATVDVSRLSCKPPVVGQLVRAVGNPMSIRFATTYGRVSSTTEDQAARRMWRYTTTLDLSGAGGMSGGPVFDRQTGEIVGIIVAGIGRVSPFMLMVPGPAICQLFARSI